MFRVEFLPAESSMNVLLVEDTEGLRYAFARVLRLHGLTVREAEDGQAALLALGRERPDLILTDLMMPVMDGVELIRRIKATPELSAIPVVAITADATPGAEWRAREAGAVDFVLKPVDIPDLLLRLERLHA